MLEIGLWLPEPSIIQLSRKAQALGSSEVRRPETGNSEGGRSALENRLHTRRGPKPLSQHRKALAVEETALLSRGKRDSKTQALHQELSE